MTQRPYDVILYGASGFVGKQTVAYFAKHTDSPQIHWAIAGRNQAKLEKVRQEVGVDVDIIPAEANDLEALASLVSQTRVLLNTAGPFALYGNAIVDACVRFGTHYVDITGETPWVKGLIDRYHAQAASEGTRIIPCCGFDSIPSDLGTYLVVRYLKEELGVACGQVKAYFQAFGGFNGGTLASGFNLYDSGQIDQVSDPFLLNPTQEHSPQEIELNRDPVSPQYAAEIGDWVAPFFMGQVNTRVVRRSAALFDEWGESYGQDFTYQEYLKFDPPLGWLQAAGVTAGMALMGAAMEQSLVRQFLKSLAIQPGAGPSEATMDSGWFRCELLGLGEGGEQVRGLICDSGDPGNRATVKFVCESALCLALNEGDLPNRGGILTPSTGLGTVLTQRLLRVGMEIEVKMG